MLVRNQVLTKGTDTKITPSEIYSGRRPNLSKLRVFGCAAYPILPLATFPNRNSSRLKDKEYIYVGLRGSKIYRLLSLKDFKEYSCADVRVDEYIFPSRTLPEYQEASATLLRAEQPQIENAVPIIQRSIATPYRNGAEHRAEPTAELNAPVEASQVGQL